MVVEDTVLLRPDVTYTDIAEEVGRSGAPAGVWGYGDRWERKDDEGNVKIGWFGLKGVWMTPAWCEEMSVILQNTNFQHYQHVDMWLVGLLRKRKARGSWRVTGTESPCPNPRRRRLSSVEPGCHKFLEPDHSQKPAETR